MNRLKKQISRQKQEYEQLKKKYDKLYKGDKGNKKDKVSSTPKTPKDKTWKPGYYKSKTPRVKHSSTIKSNKTPKMKHNVSVPVVPVIDKSKKKKKTKLNVKAPTSVKRQVSRRYDEGFGIKIKGLSALDLFLKQHDQEKKEKEENQDNKVGLSLNKDLIEQEEEEEDFETDEDFQNENDQKLENIVEAHED